MKMRLEHGASCVSHLDYFKVGQPVVLQIDNYVLSVDTTKCISVWSYVFRHFE